MASISGTITLPEDAALEDAARWAVELQDLSDPTAPAFVAATSDVIDHSTTTTAIDFALEYDPALIDELVPYAIQARIVDAEDNELLRSLAATPVITDGAPAEGVEVDVVAPDEAAPSPTP